MKDREKEFTVIFLFNEDCTKILLQEKNRGPYAGKWNGVGGHLKEGEHPRAGAVREVMEETGVMTDLLFICTIKFYNGVTLHCFCGVVFKDDVKQTEDERLEWYNLNDYTSLELAGDGNVPWLVGEGLNLILRRD